MAKSSGETSKQRTGRIPLDYFRTPDRMTRWRNRSTVLALLVAVVWLVAVAYRTQTRDLSVDRLALLANHGPLSNAHASFETDCEKCHVPFTPINRSGWTSQFARWTKPFVVDTHGNDQKCQGCHKSLPHYPLEADPSSCASCHQEHQGREFRPTDVNTVQCVGCHATVKQSHVVRSDGKPVKALEDVKEFDRSLSDHPEFALFRKGPPVDPGAIKFNHALHMTPGQADAPGEQPLMTYGNLPEAYQAFYQAGAKSPGKPADAVALRCESCHQLGSAASGLASPFGAAKRGDVVLPIRFEKHCNACHANTYKQDQPPVRHGLQPAELYEEIWQRYASEFIKGHPELIQPRMAREPIPGHDISADLPATARNEVTAQVDRAVRSLYSEKRCAECHSFETLAQQKVDPNQEGLKRDSIRVVPASIRSIWYEGARFDHAAHQTQDCLQCHASASPKDSHPSTSNTDVLIPNSENCRNCHAPIAMVKGEQKGGAGTSCLECHGYHGEERRWGANSLPLTNLRPADPAIQQFIVEAARAKR